jgi:hypothetical protein
MSNLRFSSMNEAIQFLADCTDSRIIIAKKITRNLMEKMLEDRYSDDLFLKILEADPTVKVKPRTIDDQTRVEGRFVKQIVDWIKEDKVKESRLDEVTPVLKEYQSLRQKNVPEIVNENKMKYVKSQGPEQLGRFIEILKKKRPRLEDLFSHMDHRLVAQDGDYRMFLIEHYDDAAETILESRWCVREEETFRRYDPPFYLFTKGNKLYALLNIEGELDVEKIDFEEWLTDYEDMHYDYVVDELKKEYVPDQSDVRDLVEKMMEENYEEFLEERERERQIFKSDEEEEELSAQDWYETQDIQEYQEEAEARLEYEYEPDEDEIRDQLAKIYDDEEEEYMYRPIPGTGKGIEFKDAGNTDMNEGDMRPIVKLLMEGLGKDADGVHALQAIFEEYGPEEAERLVNDPIEMDLMLGRKVDMEALAKHPEKQKLREQYPDYFRELAEHKGQRKLFEMASVNDAVQHLANITQKRIVIKST